MITASSNSARTYRFGQEFELDPSRRCLVRNGTEIHLREKVFQVLLYLVEHRDRVVPKEELLERVWKGAAVTDDALFGCVIELRKALGDDRRNNRVLRTVPKTGYRFVTPLETPGSPLRDRFRRKRGFVAVVTGIAAALSAGLWYGTSGTAAPSARGKVAWWRLDEGAGAAAADSSRQGNAGVLRGPIRWIDGHAGGKALRFEGSGARVEGAELGRLLPLGDSPRSVALWMRATTANGDDTNLFRYGRYPHRPEEGFHLYLSDNGRAGFGYGLGAGTVCSASGLLDGTWHFLTGVYQGGQTGRAHLFVDGRLEASARLPNRPETAPAEWRVGGSLYRETPYRGDIDDVRVYARALRLPQVEALYRCSASVTDLVLPDGSPGYFLPVWGEDSRPLITIRSRASEQEKSSSLEQTGTDFAGIQFARAGGACGLSDLEGVDVGHDLYIGMDVKVPGARGGRLTAAGPYFRSRAAAPGDGIIGGASAGFWVQLGSDGVVKVCRLNPHEILAFTSPLPDFQPDIFHRLEIQAKGDLLRTVLDGRLLVLEQNGRRTSGVHIPPVWKGPPAIGHDDGCAGVAFLARPRGAGGGQQVRNIVVSRASGGPIPLP